MKRQDSITSSLEYIITCCGQLVEDLKAFGNKMLYPPNLFLWTIHHYTLYVLYAP